MTPQLLALNGSGGAYKTIVPPISCRRITVVEDASVTPQGLTYKQIGDGFTAVFTCAVPGSPNEVQIEYMHPSMMGSGAAVVVGTPEQNLANGVGAFNYQAPVGPLQLRSKTATGTTVSIMYYE